MSHTSLRNALGTILLIVLGALPLPAQDSSDTASDVAAVDDAGFDDDLDALLAGEAIGDKGSDAGGSSGLTGFVELRPRVYLEDRNGPRVDDQLLVEAELELERDLGRSFSFYARPHLLVDASDDALFRTEASELYLSWERQRFSLRLGRMVENWGVADTTNPLDVLNRRDLGGDLLDPQRLAETGVRLRWEPSGGKTFGEPTLSLYLMPVFRPTLFAPDGQRFALGDEDRPFVDHGGFEPEGSDEGFAALRFTSTLATRPFDADLQLLATRGPTRLPLPTPGADGSLRPIYYGVETVGAGLRAVANEEVLGRFLASLTLKAEFAWNAPWRYDGSPIEAPDSYLSFVVGFDRVLYNVLRDQDQVTLTLEYAGETGADDLAARFRPFADDLIARAFWEANDFARRSLELRLLYDLESDETVIELTAETQLRKLHEDLQLQVQLQLFDPPGTGESFFDLFPDNDSLAVALRWDF